MRPIFYILFAVFAGLYSFSQKSKADSLLKLLKAPQNPCAAPCLSDTNRIKNLNNLAVQLMYNDPDTGITLCKQSLALLELLSDAARPRLKRLKGKTFANMGLCNYYKAEYGPAQDCFFNAIKILEEIGDKNGAAANLGNLGLIQWEQGNYPKALEYYFKSLKRQEELNAKAGISSNLANIGNVYRSQGDYSKAQYYQLKALKMIQESGNKQDLAICLSDLGVICLRQLNYPKALEYYASALKINEEIQDKRGIAVNLGNIEGVYFCQLNYPKALDYYLKSMKMNEELGDNSAIATSLNNVGLIYIRIKKFKEAEEYLQKSLRMDAETELLNEQGMDHFALSQLYDTMALHAITKMYNKEELLRRSFFHFKKYISIRDSLYNEANTKKTLQTEMQYDYDKKEAAIQAAQEKKDAVTAQEKQKETVIRNALIGGFLLVLVLGLVVFRSYRQKQKANMLLEEKNILIAEQKQFVEEKHKEITDSINYARRIQIALITSEKYIEKNLKRLMK